MGSAEIAGLYLLDTHAWIWLESGKTTEFTPTIRSVLRTAAAQGAVLVSAISAWEVGTLAGKGRIRLSLGPIQWLEAVALRSAVRIEPVTAEIAMASTQLPRPFHRDPADQIIVATARALGATLVTRDRQIARYSKLGHVRVLAI